MSGATIRLHEKRLPLKSPFGTSRWQLTEREMLILELHDPRSGFTGYGEAAPLEAFGTESMGKAKTALLEFLKTADFDKALDAPAGDVPGFTDVLTATPTARYAVECAILDILAMREGVPLRIFLGGDEDHETIKVNAVAGDRDVVDTAVAAQRAVDDGFGCIKLKAGAREIDEDVDRVVVVRETAGNDMLIRLDINGAWSRRDAESAIGKLEPLGIEYIEQPLDATDRDGMAGLAAESPIPIAADESLQGQDDIEFFASTKMPVFILKPMALGGLLRLRETAKSLHEQSRKVIVTSFIDSAVGRAAVMHFAASMPFLQEYHHGLDTGRLFAKDLAGLPAAEGGFIHVPSGNGIGVLPNLEGEG